MWKHQSTITHQLHVHVNCDMNGLVSSYLIGDKIIPYPGSDAFGGYRVFSR